MKGGKELRTLLWVTFCCDLAQKSTNIERAASRSSFHLLMKYFISNTGGQVLLLKRATCENSDKVLKIQESCKSIGDGPATAN
mmetsp:Transcript_2763/g.4124  ORF Transcript_2763/g.4124 Transcript_2763/m.4124 type:complete len:83 (+) Transcript_2763:1911-2159(+)